jgi:hypothetical protein
MINIDLEGFRALVWYYANIEGIITPKTWEKLICKSTIGGIHIHGDKYMADGKAMYDGLSIKTIQRKFTVGDTQTIDIIQCRCPIKNKKNIDKEIIETLVKKRKESFEKFNLRRMLNVIVIHNRNDHEYAVRLFISEQEQYEDVNYEWIGNCAYLKSDMSKKRKWVLKRNDGEAGSFQACLYMKKVLNVNDCIANFTIKCDNDSDISIEEVKEKYAKVQSK